MTTSKFLTAGVAALALGGAILASTTSADARPGFRGGGGARGGFARGGGFRGGFAGQRFGGYRGGYGGRGFRYAGAGIGAGLALGALAATAYPYGGYGGYGYYGGYRGVGYGGCGWEPRQFVDRYGRRYIRDVEVCY